MRLTLIGLVTAAILAMSPLGTSISKAADTAQVFEEIPINFQVRRLINADIFAQYDGKDVFLPVMGIFDLLDLNIKPEMDKRRFSGYVISNKNKFRIDLDKLTVRLHGRDTPLHPSDFLLTTTDLFLRESLFGPLLGLPVTFIFADLRVVLPLDEDYPAYQKLKRAMAQKRLQQKEKELGRVKWVPYRRQLLGGCILDWSLAANPVGSKVNHFGFNLGSMLLGGDLSVSGAGNTRTGMSEDQLKLHWHYFFDYSPYLIQGEIGDVYTGGILSRTIRGGMITNRPQVQRKFFRTTRIAGRPGEGWEVELYIDRTLVDFTHTGPSGEYEFFVDANYGSSIVTLKLYGPSGEIRTEEQYIHIPYNLVPRNSIEYAIAVGAAQNQLLNSKYTQVATYYGVSNRVTVGLLTDIPLDRADAEPVSVAGEATVQLAGNLTANAGHAPGYASQVAMNFSQPSLVSIDGSLTSYRRSQYRTGPGKHDSYALSVTAPMRVAGRPISLRSYATWDRYPLRDLITINFGGTASLRKVNLYYLGKYNISRYINFSGTSFLSELFASVSFSRWLRPQFRVVYDHSKRRVASVAIFYSRRLFRTGQISFSYEREMHSNSDMFRVSLNIFTNFASFTTRVATTSRATNITQVQQGSVRYDQTGGRFMLDRYYGVGRSAMVVRPFMDDNHNGMLDKNERIVEGLRARIRGGRERPRGSNRMYYYDGLNPYAEHLVSIDPLSLDDPMLKPLYENYRVAFNPNVVTAIDVPIVMAGEASGFVHRKIVDGLTPQGGLTVVFYNLDLEIVTEVMTFSNGEFFYLGLIPGNYRAYIDSEQLDRLGYKCEPEGINFEMEAVENGAIVSNLNFVISAK